MGMMMRRAARLAVGTAVVAGTAGAVQHHQNQKYATQDAAANAGQQDAYAQGLADAQAAAAQQAPAAPAKDDTTAQLEQLAELKNKGILTEEEFQAKKKQILGI
jgi:hypothetical protein